VLWGWWVDGQRPDTWDVLGACICVAGVAIIMYAPRLPRRSLDVAGASTPGPGCARGQGSISNSDTMNSLTPSRPGRLSQSGTSPLSATSSKVKKGQQERNEPIGYS
jgi:hypothetical protein